MPTAYGIAKKGGEKFLPVILVPVPALVNLNYLFDFVMPMA